MLRSDQILRLMYQYLSNADFMHSTMKTNVTSIASRYLFHFMIVVFTDLLDYYLLTIVTCASMYESFATLFK